MTASVPANPAERILAHVESAVVEDEVLHSARDRANDLGAKPVTASVGATLSFLARVMSARTVVEIGTGAGVSGLWLLRGMRSDGVLTTIDIEPEHQRAAKQTFNDAGISAGRFRLINGRALEVLPRLTDAGYDLVFVDAAAADHLRYLSEALRLLRAGGAVVLHGSLAGGRISDPAQRDQATVAFRETARMIAEDERLVPLLLPLGDGLQAAALAG